MVVLRGRRGTHGTGWRAWARLVARDAAALCVAGVALGDIHLDFTWQAWRNLTSRVVLRGKRGTHGTGWRAWARLVACDAAALCVAGVALGDIHLDFTWRGTISHPRSFCVAGMALMALGGALGPAWSRVTPRHCAWQAWHLVTSTLISRGRRGTISHPGMSGAGWPAWARLVARDAAALCVAGVALGDIHLDFTWRGTISHPRSFCVAGVALMALGGALGPAWSRVTPRHCAWQAWHMVTSTLISRGKRGAISHPGSFCVARVALMALGGALGTAWARLVARDAAALSVAGVALGDIHLDFTWQTWQNLTSTVVLLGRRGTHGPWVARLVARDAAALLRGRRVTW